MTSINPTIITIIIATATFLLGIFSALQFFASRMERYIDARFDGLRGEMRAEFAAVNNRIGDVQARLERVERQIDTLFGKLQPIPPGRGD